MLKRLGALTLAVPLAGACAMPDPPSDDVLLERFRANEAAFEQLLKDQTNRELQAKLGVTFVRGEAGTVHLPVWHHDFVGPGGMEKGFAHTREEPRPLVDSIDRNSADPSEQKTIYRRIKGSWYLYYSASN